MSGVEDMIAEAEKSLGLGEPNYIQAWYSTKVNTSGWGRNWAWCDAAITYWAHHSGNAEPVVWGGYFAYTVAHAQIFKSKGQWHTDTAGIKRGDIVFFDWAHSNNIGAIDHVGIVTSVKGGNVYTIEGNTENKCARRVRQASTIAGYGRPKYATAPKPAPPKPKDEPYKPPPFPAGLRPDSSDPSAKGLQRALKAADYMAETVKLSANYGPLTQAAVKRFHKANPQFGAANDPAIGPMGWAHLHREAYA